MSEEKKTDVMVEETAKTSELDAVKAENETLKKELEKMKLAQSNASADAAKNKREKEEWIEKYKSKCTEEEKVKLETEARVKALEEENLSYKKKERISTYTARLIEVGFDPQTAATMAVGLPEGISDDFFATQKSFLDQQKQIAKTEALNNQPGLSAGTPPTAPSSKEDLKLREWMGLPTK